MTLILSGTDGLSDVDGTAATPAIRGTDANTGIFFGTDIIGFSEGGAEAMRIDSSGNLLVGTTSALAPSSGRGNITVNGSTDAILAFGIGAATAGYIYQGPSSLVVNTQGAKPITFESSGVERGRFSATGALVLQGGNTAANGIGITFPATPSASSDANTLDDYEEGTFTPTIIGSTTAGTGTYSTHQVGAYTKVGRAVTIQIRLSWTAHTGTGSMLVSGLPFTILSGGVQPSFTVGDARDIALTASNILQLFSDTNVTTIQFIQTPTGGGASGNVPIDTSATIILSGTYFTS